MKIKRQQWWWFQNNKSQIFISPLEIPLQKLYTNLNIWLGNKYWVTKISIALLWIFCRFVQGWRGHYIKPSNSYKHSKCGSHRELFKLRVNWRAPFFRGTVGVSSNPAGPLVSTFEEYLEYVSHSIKDRINRWDENKGIKQICVYNKYTNDTCNN